VAIPTLALGIEYPGSFALNQNLLTPGEDFGSGSEGILLESTVAHETAHEWFYNLVGNDQLDDPWLDEAMAQYAMLEYYEVTYGEPGANSITESFYGRWDRVEREDIPIGLPVEAYGELTYYSIVYGRGPLFFVELRESLGTEAFDAFLREYTATFSWEEATPEGLQQMAEAECDCDLDDLFNEWVYSRP
jgi:aminopeptidase N